MPNIKISALPPAALPLDDPNTIFEVTVLEAGLEVSRKITLSEIAGATGLDASFLTLSANAQLPNERVLTEGTGITFVDTGPNGTLTINASVVSFPLLAPDGSAAAPSYSFANDTDAGMFLVSAGILGLSVGSVEVYRAIEAAGDVSLIIDPGNTAPAAAPALAFGDGDSGFRQPLDDNLQVVLAGTTRFFWELDSYNALAGTGPAMVNAAASATVPGFTPRRSDPNTGLGSAGNDILSLIAGGVSIAQATSVGNNQFALAQSGSSSVPELTSLADPDTGFRWTGGNQLTFIGSGSRAWHFTSARFFSEFSQGPALLNVTAQDDVPTVLADQSDSDTGIGSSGNDELSIIAGGVEGIRVEETAGNVFITYFGPILIPFGSGTQPGAAFNGDDDTGYFRPVADAFAITAGGVESVRYAELSSQIIQTNSNQVGLTASITQTQAGGLALISSYNEVSIVANSGDALTAFTVKAGDRLTVINNGANDLQLFPDVGDDIGAGVDASITIEAGSIGIFIGRVATNWDTLFNASSAGLSFPILAPDGTAGAPSYSFSGETDLGMFRLAEDFLGFSVNGITRIVVDTSGITGFIGNSGKIVSVGATANFPSVLAANGDTNTGMGWGGIDIVTLAAGGIEGVRFSEETSHIIQRNENHTGLTASVTQTQGGGLALLSSYNEVSTVANSGDALTAFGVAEGSRLVVVNNGANDLQLFPDSGEDIGNGVNASITIDAGDVAVFLGRDSTNWDTLFNAAPLGGGPGGVLPLGTVSEASLKWDGVSSWIEETQIRLTGGSTGITILDAGLSDNIRIGHDGSNALVRTTGSAEVIFGGGGAGPTTGWRFEQLIRVPDGSAAVPGITWFGDIATGIFRQALGLSVSITGVEQARFSNATTQIFSDDFRLQPNIGADLARFIVNGPSNLNDFEIELTSLIDFHVSGSTGERFVLEEFNLAMFEKAAAPADVAGTGQFWVRDDVPNIPMYTDDTGIDFKLGVANDAVQARRTTSYVLTTAFADVTLDTTDIETDDQIIEHSGTTDNIEAQVAGTYEFTYGVDLDPGAAGNDNIQAFGRMRLNDAGVDLPGSLASQSAYEDASTIGNEVFGRLQCSFIVVLAAGDFVTLQLLKVETGGTGIFTAEEVTVTAKRLL